MYITLRGIVYAVRANRQNNTAIYINPLFCFLLFLSRHPFSYSCHFGEKACRHVNVCPGIMIFNKSYIVLNKSRGSTPHQRPLDDFDNMISNTFTLKTFNRTVIFVTKVIFLGINCTFCHDSHTTQCFV